MMCNTCDDNRFKLIEKYKTQLIEATNIADSPEEMAVLDTIFFRFWQMDWLDKLEKPAQQWIPCSERLPDQNGKYLVVGRQKAINILKFDGGRWYGKWGVVAWMPLPSPYREETES